MHKAKRYLVSKFIPFDCPDDKVGIVHITQPRLAKRIYTEGLKPKCFLPDKISRKKVGMKSDYYDEPKTMRQCSVFARLTEDFFSESWPARYLVCACVNPTKAYVANYAYADLIFRLSNQAKTYKRFIVGASDEKIPPEKKSEIINTYGKKLKEVERYLKIYATKYNKSVVTLKDYMSKPKKERYMNTEVLVPNEIPPSDLRNCIKRKYVKEKLR